MIFRCAWCGGESSSFVDGASEILDELARILHVKSENVKSENLCMDCASKLRRDLLTTTRLARLLSTDSICIKDLASKELLEILRVELEQAELAFDLAGYRDEKWRIYDARLALSEAVRAWNERQIGPTKEKP